MLVVVSSQPLAYLLTWPTYGSRLHGDERGSVDRAHNQPHTPMLDHNPNRLGWEREHMSHAPVVLTDEERRIVAQTVRDHCVKREWERHAIAVRTNHVHVVVGYAGLAPERMMSEFKAWTTRRLRAAGHAQPHQRLWVHHGSTRYLWNPQSVESAIAYIDLGQDIPR